MKQSFLVLAAAVGAVLVSSCQTAPKIDPAVAAAEKARAEAEARNRREAEERRLAEKRARAEAERQRQLAEAKAKEQRKQQRLKEYEERKARERAEKIAAAQMAEQEAQARHRNEVSKAKSPVSSAPSVTARYDKAARDGTLAKEAARIKDEGAAANGVDFAGFRLGMDVQDAFLLAKHLFPGVAWAADSNRGSLRVLVGPKQDIDVSSVSDFGDAFLFAVQGTDVSYVFAEADSGSREVTSLRVPAEIAKRLFGIDGAVSNEQLVRAAFGKLGLSWERDWEYDVYTARIGDVVLQGFTKETKVANSWLVLDPGDLWLHK